MLYPTELRARFQRTANGRNQFTKRMVIGAGFTHHDSRNLRSIRPRYGRTPRLRRSAHHFWLSRCSGTPLPPNRPRYVKHVAWNRRHRYSPTVTFSNLQNFDINATPLLAFSEYLPDRTPLRKVRELVPLERLDIRFFFAIIFAHG
jgi:hypothetical protein